MPEISFEWVIENLTEDEKNDIKEKIKTKISEISDYKVFNVEITKNPKGGADILITYNDSKFTLEGRYQVHRPSVAIIVWADNPLPGIR
jgi:hypothetical protein